MIWEQVSGTCQLILFNNPAKLGLKSDVLGEWALHLAPTQTMAPNAIKDAATPLDALITENSLQPNNNVSKAAQIINTWLRPPPKASTQELLTSFTPRIRAE